MTTPARRPGLVTLIVVLVVISGVLSIIGGIIILTASGVVALGAVAILIGVVYLLVAKGLLDGNSLARTIVAVVTVLNIATGVWSLLVSTGNARSSGIGSIIFGVIVLAILYSRRSNEFFTGSQSPAF